MKCAKKDNLKRKSTYTALCTGESVKKVVVLFYNDHKINGEPVRFEEVSYAAMGVRLELSFLAAASSASLTAWIVRLLSFSISCAFAPNTLL